MNYNNLKNFINNNNGVALIITILLMSLILFLSLYFLSFSLTENRIAGSQTLGAKTYYLAEAGVAEIVWKLKNDNTYKNNFETDPNWIAALTRVEPFGSGSGSYIATITNSNLATGEILSQGSIDLGNGNISQRIVKIAVYKALGTSAIGTNAGYANGNVDISTSNVNFINGGAHSNNNFTINGYSVVDVGGDLDAVVNIIESWKATTSISGVRHAQNHAPAASHIDMPSVDFDSINPNSYLNSADIVYTEDEFETLMENNPNLVLNDPITYVDGDVEVEDLQSLTINGVLVIKGGFEIEEDFNALTVNHTVGDPSGIIAYDDIEIEDYTGSLDINGILYSADKVDITDIPASASTININGAIVSRKLTITNVDEPFNITYDNEIVVSSLPATNFSPVVIFDHWEEEY